MNFLGYLLILISLIIVYFVYKKTTNKIIITPYILFTFFLIGGIYTSIYAVKNNFVDNYLAVWVYFFLILAFSFGYYYTFKYIKPTKSNVNTFSNKSIHLINNSERIYSTKAIWPLLVLLFVLGLIQYQGFPPLLLNVSDLFTGNFNLSSLANFASDRLDLTKSHYFGGEYRGQGFIRLFLKFGFTFLLVYSYVMYSKSRMKKWFLLFIIMIFLSIAFVAGDGTRLPIIRVFLVLFITISIISKVSIRGLIAFSLISFALVIGLSMLTNKFYTILSSNDNILLSSIESILARIVTGNQINDVIVIDYLSKGTMSYYYGFQHYVQVINSFPGVSNYESFSLTIARLYNAGNSTTYMTPTYLAVSYADFGFIITLINYTFIGVIIAYFEKKMFSFTKSPLNITLISILMLEFGFMALSGIIKFLPALIVIALIYIFMYFSIVLTIKTYSHKQKTIINGGIV